MPERSTDELTDGSKTYKSTIQNTWVVQTPYLIVHNDMAFYLCEYADTCSDYKPR